MVSVRSHRRHLWTIVGETRSVGHVDIDAEDAQECDGKELADHTVLKSKVRVCEIFRCM